LSATQQKTARRRFLKGRFTATSGRLTPSKKPSVNASPFLIILIIVMLEIFGKDGGDHHVDDQHDCHYQVVCYIELVGVDKG
jgi:hypothetical protein